MKLSVLVDNNTLIDHYYLGEPGLSFYIEDENKKILFDTGYSDIFLSNAKKLNINLNPLDYLVLSHGHNDHTGGLQYIKNDLQDTTLICHPDVFKPRVNQGLFIGSPIQLKDLNFKEYLNGTKSISITNHLYYLGQIKRTNSFEAKGVGTLIDGSIDYLYDDTALVYQSSKGLFIITACSHSGICNICEQAKSLFPNQPIIGIIGGFHLMKDDEQLNQTIQYLKQNNIPDLYPCHCCSLISKIKMASISKIHEVGVGFTIEI